MSPGEIGSYVNYDSATATTAFLILAIVGTVAFSISGVMAAARANMDWLGAIVLAIVVAVGGGTIRDLLMGELPVSWLQDAWPVVISIATAVFILVILRLKPKVEVENWTPIEIADAAGLSAFVIIGTEIGLAAGLNPFFAILLGTVSGVGGGVLRDLLTGNKPMVLVGQIYAVAGISGAALFTLMAWAGVSSQISVWICVVVILVIRLLAIRGQWSLPKALLRTR